MNNTLGNKRKLTVALATCAVGAVAAWLGAAPSQAQSLSGNSLIDALKGGGYVLVMRRASTSSQPPGPRQAAPGNVGHEPQLDDMGEATVEAMGYAFRKFAIPVGDTYASPLFSAYETAHFFGFGARHKVPELGTERPSVDWLRKKAAEKPRAGQNNVIVTQESNLEAAFGKDAANLEPGEALIFRADGDDTALVARMPIKDWAKLAVLGHT